MARVFQWYPSWRHRNFLFSSCLFMASLKNYERISRANLRGVVLESVLDAMTRALQRFQSWQNSELTVGDISDVWAMNLWLNILIIRFKSIHDVTKEIGQYLENGCIREGGFYTFLDCNVKSLPTIPILTKLRTNRWGKLQRHINHEITVVKCKL